MTFSLKTRILLGLTAVCMCIVVSPLAVPAESPPPQTVAEAREEARDRQDLPVAARSEESPGLQRAVVPNLPFTGLDLVTLMGVVAALMLISVALRRLSAPPRAPN